MLIQFIGAHKLGGPRPQKGSILGLPCILGPKQTSDPGIQITKTKVQETTATK